MTEMAARVAQSAAPVVLGHCGGDKVTADDYYSHDLVVGLSDLF